MTARLSRRKLAAYYADQLLANQADIAEQLAAYLIDSRRTKELALIVRDIEDALLERGTMVAHVASAHTLTSEVRKAITNFLAIGYDNAAVILQESVDETLLGGARIRTPDAEFDGSLRRKIMNIKASKV